MSVRDEPKTRPVVLHVDEDKAFARALAAIVCDDIDLHTCNDGRTALSELESKHHDAVLAALEFSNGIKGLDLLGRIRALHRPGAFIEL